MTNSLATDFEYYARSMNLETRSGSQQHVWQSKAHYFSLPENTIQRPNFKAMFQTQFHVIL